MSALSDPNRPPKSPRRFLPYRPHALDPTLPLEVASVRVDSSDETDAVLDPSRCRIRPHLVGDWELIEVAFRAPDLRAAVAERAGLKTAPASVAILGKLSCRETRLRRAIRFAPATDGEALEANLELDRRDVRDKVELQLFAVVRELPGKLARDLAHHEGSLLAVSPIWVIEERDLAMPAGGAFEVAYIDFKEPAPNGPYRGEDAPELRAIPDALVHVVFRPEGPLVLMNEHHPDLRLVLFSKGTRGWRARLRDLLAQRVAATVWRSVLTEAWQQVRPAEGFPDPDERSWALLGEEHWTTRALDRAAQIRTRKDDEPIPALLDLIEDESSRAGILSRLSEELAHETDRSLPRLVEELDGK